MKFLKSLLLVICPLATCFAVETRFWQQGDRADFEKGSLTHLSLRSDGRIFLAPEFPEVFDSSTPYLWSVATDSKGNVYTAGGGSGSGSAKLFQIDRSGKGRAFSELDGLEIHAVAVDSKDQVYAATDPDGKVYKISSDGKARTFYDPHQKYIWAMAFNSKGDLFVATGDQGEIHRVTSNGSGSVFFRTEETHARSLAIDAQDNLIIGTEPNGLVLRVSASGQGFVLYQAPKREITAVAVAKNGAIYASGVGTKGAMSPPPAAAGQVTVAVGPGAAQNQPGGIGNVANRNLALATSVAGGSEVYRINPDGSPRKVWSNSQDVVYAVGFDQSGRTLLGTGNRGKVYRLDSDAMSTVLLDATPTQVTGFGTSSSGEVYAVTGNIGKVFRIGPGFQKSGSFESEVLDAGSFAYWGRVGYRGAGNISLFTRSGNLNHPESNWSPWTPVRPDAAVPLCDSCGGGRAPSPSARFLQYKIELNSSAAIPAPEVFFVETAYLPKNVPPVIEMVEVASPNYRFPRPLAAATPSNSLTLAPIGQPRRSSTLSSDSDVSQTLTYAKGYNGARWSVTDENGDSLIYKVEIRGVKESAWRLLKDEVKEKYLSWDTTAFPDGEYVLRITASDSPSNPRDQALEDARISDPFVIDNTPPQISNLAGSVAGNNVDVRWTASDSRSDITKAECSINGGEWSVVDPVSKLSDSPQAEYHLVIERSSPGEQVVAVRVTDEFDNQAVEKVVVK